MAPIYRGADRPMRVPKAIIEGVEQCQWWLLDDNGIDDDDYERERAALRKFVKHKRGPMDADTFSAVRSILDIDLINGGCHHEHYAEERTLCDWCDWCQTLIFRDWMDALMDVAGCYRSPYVNAYGSGGEGDPDECEARYKASDCGCHLDCAEECKVHRSLRVRRRYQHAWLLQPDRKTFVRPYRTRSCNRLEVAKVWVPQRSAA